MINIFLNLVDETMQVLYITYYSCQNHKISGATL